MYLDIRYFLIKEQTHTLQHVSHIVIVSEFHVTQCLLLYVSGQIGNTHMHVSNTTLRYCIMTNEFRTSKKRIPDKHR